MSSKIGDRVLLVRHPDQHGHDAAPAVVTHVHKPDAAGVEHGTVHVHGAETVPDVHLVADRPTAERLLAEHIRYLVRGRGEPKPTIHDVLPWVHVAYPADVAAAPKAEPVDDPERYLTPADRDWIRQQREAAGEPADKPKAKPKAEKVG